MIPLADRLVASGLPWRHLVPLHPSGTKVTRAKAGCLQAGCGLSLNGFMVKALQENERLENKKLEKGGLPRTQKLFSLCSLLVKIAKPIVAKVRKYRQNDE